MTAGVSGARRLCRVAVAAAVVGVWPLAGCQSSAVPAGPPSSQASRHPSGLLLVPAITESTMPAAVPATLDPANGGQQTELGQQG